jgi:hypothetical protein
VTVYVDKPRAFFHKRKKYCHLMADTLDELHAFAARIGCKRCWFDRDHYDLREHEFELAVAAGAVVVSSRELVKLRKK